ncbi:hypothetical protein QWA_18237 [Alcaligenes faecalis subsp. faecalis NCIB 8687]|nr:hypothetical protein QWA_18237 [Alcaligenes faecalis subsp. faecalis NCIB 8687]
MSFHETFQASEEDEEQDDELDKRDLLGEMLIAAISCKERGAKHPLTQDVALQLMHMNKDQTMSPARPNKYQI